eukprot:SM000239S08074  [mRNA]  locus=s239:12763:16131:+ [translate_table: standard]
MAGAGAGGERGARLFQGVDKASAAFRLMQRLGWEEGAGLGKQGQGIREHLRVRKNVDHAGVGVAEAQRAASDWTVNTSVFDDILRNLNVAAAARATEPAAEPVVPKVHQLAWYKKRAGTGLLVLSKAEARDADDITGAPKQGRARKAARPQGRYKKREAGKSVRSYSTDDLSAILGERPSTAMDGQATETSQVAPAAAVPEPKRAQASSSDDSADEEVVHLAAAVPSTLGRLLSSKQDDSVKASGSWWGSKYGFIRGGALGAKSDHPTASQDKASEQRATAESSEAASDRVAFSEQDQTNLYNLVQDNATKGRRGLGIADAPRKVAGVHWKGARTSFGSDNEETSDGAAATRSASGGLNAVMASAEASDAIVRCPTHQCMPEHAAKRKRLRERKEERVAEELSTSREAGGKASSSFNPRLSQTAACTEAPGQRATERKKRNVRAGALEKRQLKRSMEDTVVAGDSSPLSRPQYLGQITKKRRAGDSQGRSPTVTTLKAAEPATLKKRRRVKVGEDPPHGSMPKGGGKVKWKKLIRQALQDAPPCGMKLKRLQKQVLAAASSTGAPCTALADLAEAFRKEVEGSSHFLLQGERVVLAA